MVVNHTNTYDPTLMEHHQDLSMASLEVDIEVDRDRHPLVPLPADPSGVTTGTVSCDNSAREKNHIPPLVEVSSS